MVERRLVDADRAPAAPAQRVRLPYVRLVLNLAVGGVLIAILFRFVDAGEVRYAIGASDPRWAGLAIALALASQVARAVRWQTLLGPLGGRMPLARLTGVLLVGMAGNALLPLRAGDLLRVQYLGSRGLARPAVLGSLAAERLLDGWVFAACFIAAGVGLWSFGYVAAGVVLGAGVGLGLFLGLRLAASGSNGGPALGWLPPRLALQLRPVLAALGQGLAALRSAAALGQAALASAVVWALEIGAYAAAGKAAGLGGDVWTYVAIVAVANVVLALPLAQAGLGTFELAVTRTAASLGSNESLAAAFSLIVHGILVVPALLAGLIAALLLRVRPGELFYVRRPRGAQDASG